MDRVSRHLVITGRVQGVSYRAWLIEQARALGLAGWVRNRVDGSVEAVVQGPAAAVDAIVARAHRGPSAARVQAVAVSDGPGEAATGFAMRPTA